MTAQLTLAGHNVPMPSEADREFYNTLGKSWVGYGIGRDEPHESQPVYLTLIYQIPAGHTKLEIRPRLESSGSVRVYDVYSGE